MKTIILFLTFQLFICSLIDAARLRFIEQTVVQPNGNVLNIFASGDEFYHWLHDKDGFTVIQNPETGYYTYAVLLNNKIQASNYIPGINIPEDIGLKPWLRISEKDYQKRVIEFNKSVVAFRSKTAKLKSAKAEPFHTGNINNLLVFITFKDGEPFTKSLAHFNTLLNAPNYSLYNYYKEVSYNKLNFKTFFYPINTDSSITVSYTDIFNRSYYQPYNKQTNTIGYKTENENYTRLMQLLKNALEYVKNDIPKDLVIDKDNDGYIDNLSFVVQGKPDGWGDLIWPHMSSFGSTRVTVNGARASLYTLQMENTNVYTFCHEMFHMLGAPDLYHYDKDYNYLEPIGNWGLMESGFVHMSAHMKYKYADKAWITDIPTIDSSGRYTLYPLTNTEKNCFKIKTRTHLNTDEFFMLEYRKKESDIYEKNLPQSGLLLYRINEQLFGNADGPPDEVYLYRPNGWLDVNGIINSAAMQNISGFAVSDDANIKPFLSDGRNSGLKIYDVSQAGDSIMFSVDLNQSKNANVQSFFVLGQPEEAIIDSVKQNIHIKLEAETNFSNIRPVIGISDFASIFPESNSIIDLSSPFEYVVTAEDGTTKTWTVTAERLLNHKSIIQSFAFMQINAEVDINNTFNRITAKLPYGSSAERLIPIGKISLGAKITPLFDSITAYDFSNPQIFTVVAQNLHDTSKWTIQVLIDKNKSKYTLDSLVTVTTKYGTINIASLQDDLRYSLYSINGTKLKTGNINGSTQVILNGIPGVYILEVENELGRMIKKIRINMN